VDPKFVTFRPFSPSFLRAGTDYRTEYGCRVPITGRKMAAGARVPRQRYIRDLADLGATPRVLTASVLHLW